MGEEEEDQLVIDSLSQPCPRRSNMPEMRGEWTMEGRRYMYLPTELQSKSQNFEFTLT